MFVPRMGKEGITFSVGHLTGRLRLETEYQSMAGYSPEPTIPQGPLRT